MLYLIFQFFYAVISLQIEVGPIIIGLAICGFVGLEDKWGDVVGSEKMRGTIIEVAVMEVKEEDLWIEIEISTGPTE